MNEPEQPVAFFDSAVNAMSRQRLTEATSQVQYVSQGHWLVIGDPEAALSAAALLPDTGVTIVSVDPSVHQVNKQLTESGVAVFTVPELHLGGYLGAFRATVPATQTGQSALDLAVSTYRESGYFDLVLDLSPVALLGMPLPPFGYCHATSADAISHAIESLSDLVGEFEKPRYFSYNESICAHSRSELSGCTQCLDACATGAITSNGEGITVDPFLCQGCGSCATVCPSGAMTYAYPRPADAIERSRQAVGDRSDGILVLHTESTQSAVDPWSTHDTLIPLLVEEVSAFGADYWLTLLAGGVQRILLVLDSTLDDPGRLALQAQLAWIKPLLASLEAPDDAIALVEADQLSSVLGGMDARLAKTGQNEGPSTRWAGRTAQRFTTHGDKRQTLRMALDALAAQMTPESAVVQLPEGAPFGKIQVDTQACTLCMACVSTCPAKALQDGQDTPALRFVESNCLQCGLCEKACPESAISLQAQYTWDSVAARKVDTLHSEQPFHCMRCHKAFATQAMIDTMTEKLSAHWMFQDDKALRRLKLCGDCRVKDMFEEDASGISVHRPSS